MLKKWKAATALLSATILCSAPALAAPISFTFSIDEFRDVCADPNDGVCTSDQDNPAVNRITGSFTGEDTNGDGYLSSFLFAPQSELANSGFTAGYNEISAASFTLSGLFIEHVPGYEDDPITSYTVTHDLTDITDEMFGFPVDFFFLLNYDLTSGGVLGDGEYEGIFMGMTTINFALGQFLPSSIAVNTITENLLVNGNATPCIKRRSVRRCSLINP